MFSHLIVFLGLRSGGKLREQRFSLSCLSYFHRALNREFETDHRAAARWITSDRRDIVARSFANECQQRAREKNGSIARRFSAKRLDKKVA
jgi:hypothetical protein